jgi:thioredoxin-like negative regulator of GroEL
MLFLNNKYLNNYFILVLILNSVLFLSFVKPVSSSEKNITYMQILQKPNDLELNLKYAQQQGKMGNFKQTISTLERLNMLYPDNVEIKLYLLSVLVQADSPQKAGTIIEEMKLRRDLSAEDLETLRENKNEFN